MKVALIDFSMKNFKIFKDKVTLSMEWSKKNWFWVKDSNLLRTSIIFWPNASGKSTILEWMKMFQTIINNSHIFDLSKSSDSNNKLIHNWFKLSNTQNEPTEFSIAIAIDDHLYEYLFQYNDDWILYEELKKINKSTTQTLFRRIENKLSKESVKYKWNKNIMDQTSAKTLFLTSSAWFQHKLSKTIIEWINQINILSALWSRSYKDITSTYLESNIKSKSQITSYMKSADFLIEDIKIERLELKSWDEFIWVLFAHPVYIDKAKQEKYRYLRDMEESDWTQQFYRLLWPIIEALEDWKILLIDEFDNSLHAFLTDHIINLFNDKKSNKKNAQLIVTTHDTSLLNKEELSKEHFRFTEKNRFWEWSLYSLYDFSNTQTKKLRNDQKYGKDYLEGRFWATPFISKTQND